ELVAVPDVAVHPDHGGVSRMKVLARITSVAHIALDCDGRLRRRTNQDVAHITIDIQLHGVRGCAVEVDRYQGVVRQSEGTLGILRSAAVRHDERRETGRAGTEQ